ncbi:DNA methyltransferase [Campylobacter felis]|uniref:DNA methyltransferase n=1 Tax=Campylobacter felis TaxID=2974565 RepID=UPI0025620CF6|nr:DNA methyltransferase [Campylobacter felis]
MKDLKEIFEKLKNDEKFRSAFKEDSVREELLKPLLDKLGFVNMGLSGGVSLEVLRSQTLQKPTITGSNSKTKTYITPDYTLYLNGEIHCVLDAKAPNQNIEKGSKNEAQVFYYAINDALRAPFYALCNGLDFKLFQVGHKKSIMDCSLELLFDEAENHFKTLKYYLSTSLKDFKISSQIEQKDDNWYLNKTLPNPINKPQKQAKARYFGCVAYFTRQSWDVVKNNIEHFTFKGDVVLDPFGGSGVSAIEALMSGRQGIHTDLNPLSIFMTKALCAKISLAEFSMLVKEILEEFELLRPKNKKETEEFLKKAKYYPNAISEDFGEVASVKMQEEVLWIPKDELLAKGSDVDSVLKLFSPLQLAELALLRKLIFEKTAKTRDKELWEQRKRLRVSLMLGFYNTLSLINLTYHNTPKGGPASAITRYYRYRLAPQPTFLNVAEIFKNKVKRVEKGKRELENSPFYEAYLSPLSGVIKDFKSPLLKKRNEDLNQTNSLLEHFNGDKIFQADATNLKELENKSVDFIYTDPPYGAKIPYLDLSTMWNAWLDLEVDLSTRKKECIEKGSLDKGREEYKNLMIASLKEMYRVLKYNRWLAFVFQHQDLQLWQILVEEAQKLGFEYVGSVRQSNGQTSFKKRQYSFTVLSGQLIMYFRKVKNPKSAAQEALDEDILIAILKHIEKTIIEHHGADLEMIYGEINIEALEKGFLHQLAKEYADLTPIINENFDYDEKSGKYHIKKNQKLKNHSIKPEKRGYYFILSYLRAAKRQNKSVSFDDICLECIPLMQNGVTPSKDKIRDILEKIAIKYDDDKWVLGDENATLF